MNYYPCIKCSAILALVSLFAIQTPHCVMGQVLPPNVSVAGMTQAEWGVLATKWVFEAPVGMNPVADTTGELSFLGDQGPVFFLDGTFGGPTVTRNVTIRDDQHIFVGILNSLFIQTEPTETEADLRALAAADVDMYDQLFLAIDGAPPLGVDLLDFRQQSPPGLYNLVFPVDNAVGAPAGTFPAVNEGYRVMLEPLSLGDHSIAFGGRVADADGNELFNSSVVYNVSVVPEPSSSLLGLSGLLAAFLFTRSTLGLNRSDGSQSGSRNP